MAKYTAEQVANFFLSKDSMSPKKIQKLVYYAYAWTLTLTNDGKELKTKLFDEQIEAWVHGPVVPSLYREYATYGYGNIPKRETEVDFTEDIKGILNEVWDVYGSFDGNELESITHQESPWQVAREGYGPLDICQEKIDDSEIYNCYIKRIA